MPVDVMRDALFEAGSTVQGLALRFATDDVFCGWTLVIAGLMVVVTFETIAHYRSAAINARKGE